MKVNLIIEKTNKEFFKEFGLTPSQINQGCCEDFAYRLKEYFPNCEIWETPLESNAPTHIWVKINNMFYDSETVNGVLKHQNLPIFKGLEEKTFKVVRSE